MQFSIHLRVIKWFFVKLISGYLTTGVMWAHSDKAQWTKLIFSLSFQMQMNTIFSSAEFFCKRNIHNLHLSVHRISVEQPVRHSTHCMSPNKTHIFPLSLSNRLISKERKSWQWRKVLETLLVLGPWADHLSATFTYLSYGCLCSRPALLTVQLRCHESDC